MTIISGTGNDMNDNDDEDEDEVKVEDEAGKKMKLLRVAYVVHITTVERMKRRIESTDLKERTTCGRNTVCCLREHEQGSIVLGKSMVDRCSRCVRICCETLWL
jgi:hypothetical protein